MIILPALPAIVAALTPVVNAVLVSAGIGAAVSGATCAVTGAVRGYQVQGEINREVAVEVVQGVPKCAAEGALVGGAFGGVGFVFAPVVTPAFTPVTQFVDDAAKSAATVVDDAVGPTLRLAGRTVTAPARMISARVNALRFRLLPDDFCSGGCLYIMDDAANGVTKVGVTTNPKRRLADVGRQVDSDVKYISIAPVDDAYAAEAALKRQFVSKNVSHPNYPKGTEWFSDLNPTDLSTIMSK